MLGTMILILFGNGVDCQVVLGGSTKVVSGPKGDYLSLNMGWAIGEVYPAPSWAVVADKRCYANRHMTISRSRMFSSRLVFHSRGLQRRVVLVAPMSFHSLLFVSIPFHSVLFHSVPQ